MTWKRVQAGIWGKVYKQACCCFTTIVILMLRELLTHKCKNASLTQPSQHHSHHRIFFSLFILCRYYVLRLVKKQSSTSEYTKLKPVFQSLQKRQIFYLILMKNCVCWTKWLTLSSVKFSIESENATEKWKKQFLKQNKIREEKKIFYYWRRKDFSQIQKNCWWRIFFANIFR